MEKATIAIGDVHGLDLWRDVVEAHPECRVVLLSDNLDLHYICDCLRNGLYLYI